MTVKQTVRRDSLGLLTGAVFVLLWLVGNFAGGTPSEPFPRPSDDMASVQRYAESSTSMLEFIAGFQMLAAVALLWFSGLLTSYLRRVGSSADLVHAAGIAASVTLSVSAAGIFTLASTDLATDAVAAQLLYQLSFWLGGPIHVAALGTMIAAGAYGLAGTLPKGITVPGLVVGGLGVLSVVCPLVPALTLLIPIGRFLGFIWLLVATITLAVRRSGH